MTGRPDEGQNVVNNRPVPRLDLDGPHPPIFGESGINLKPLIIHLASTGNRKRLRLNRVDGIGNLRQLPAGDKLWRRWHRGSVSERCSEFHPLGDRLLFLGGELPVVAERAVERAGVPRGHPLLLHNLRDHARPGLHLIEVSQGHRTDVASSMAFNAPGLEDRCDAAGIGHIRSRHRRSDLRDQAANRLRLRHRNRCSSEHRLDRLGEFMMARLGPGIPRAILVINPAAVTNLAISIEQEYFGRPGRSQLTGQLPLGIPQQGKADSVAGDVGCNLGRRVIGVGVDPNKGHSSGCVPAAEFLQPRPIQFRERALRPQKSNDEQGAWGEFVQTPLIPVHVLQRNLQRGSRNRRRDRHISRSPLDARTTPRRANQHHHDRGPPIPTLSLYHEKFPAVP